MSDAPIITGTFVRSSALYKVCALSLVVGAWFGALTFYVVSEVFG